MEIIKADIEDGDVSYPGEEVRADNLRTRGRETYRLSY